MSNITKETQTLIETARKVPSRFDTSMDSVGIGSYIHTAPEAICELAQIIDELEADLKSALSNADHWMARKEECARENAKLTCLLDDAEDKAEHWEKTCHAQWESSQQAVDDCNSFSSALAAIKDATSKGEMRRIAMQALGVEGERKLNDSLVLERVPSGDGPDTVLTIATGQIYVINGESYRLPEVEK